jgi:TolB-like protein
MLGRRALVVAALLAPLLAAAQGGTAAKKIRVAVLEIRPLGTEASKAELLSEVALTEAAGMPGFDVIGRSDINSLIGFEKQKQVMGCSDDSACLAEIGGALGVDLILVGSLGKIGTLYRLDIKLVETKKARVRSRVGVTVEGSEEKLVAAIQKAVRDLLGPEARPPEPVAAARPAGAAPAAEGKPAPSLAAQPPKAPPPVPAAGVSASAGTSRRTWAYVAGGTGLALLAGGAAAGLSAKAAYDDEKAAAAVRAAPPTIDPRAEWVVRQPDPGRQVVPQSTYPHAFPAQPVGTQRGPAGGSTESGSRVRVQPARRAAPSAARTVALI